MNKPLPADIVFLDIVDDISDEAQPSNVGKLYAENRRKELDALAARQPKYLRQRDAEYVRLLERNNVRRTRK